MGNHRVLFIFMDRADVEHVIQGEPWSFDKHLVVLKEVEKHADIKNLVFDYTSMWVQIHDVPIGLTWKAAKDIISVAGTVEESAQEDERFEGSNFLRFKVTVDVSNPLCRGRKIILRNGKESWVSFRYERLLNFCYWCGKLTHMDRECPIWTKRKDDLLETEQQFGPWLRATTPNLARKTVVRVAGFEESENDVDSQSSVKTSEEE
ncbi:uncharacterized protein At4g02000-like [Castanea sativa]|uniref:uncharacterized protein At4g02000-like n=1 Tax=Castanea sativa TaxID=21020 RepID=UPI003F64DBAC